MNHCIIAAITKSPLRASLYHFTRASNLQGMAALDGIFASALLYPEYANGIRRTEAWKTVYNGQHAVLNSHLRITPEAMEAGTTAEQFRACLDRHVFLWPTERDCMSMAAMYSRREPGETFAILKLDALKLLTDHFDHIRLSKYDSGSSPRYPHRMSYRKSCKMLLPIGLFMIENGPSIPAKPSEIKEVLVAYSLTPLSRYLQTIYCSGQDLVPAAWRGIHEPLVLPSAPHS
ncbi:hypothetical protein [Paenibacillus sp. P46E]|uniref:DUF7002 family protein n=1 Tax=Paenibacillus sp. P46E TaxID=1349436 RepID=UPI00093B6C38|nr:hypothetical protein [Paenibacillus sp. P46E]OKP94220.1 hypothetical protein A3849_29575 [Paenibacillus sp. P46E]